MTAPSDGVWRSDRYAETHQIMAGSIRVSLPDNESTAAADEDSCGSLGGSPTEPRPRPQKRRRIPVACGACRSKKSRVSKTEPEAEWDPIRAEREEARPGSSYRSPEE